MNRKDLRALVQKVILEQTREQHFEVKLSRDRQKLSQEMFANRVKNIAKKVTRVTLLEDRNNEIQSLESKIEAIKNSISDEFGIEEDDPDLTLLRHESPEEQDPEWSRDHEKLTSLVRKWEKLQSQLDILNKIDPNKPSKGERERQGQYRRGERLARRSDIKEALKPIIKRSLREAYLLEEAQDKANLVFLIGPPAVGKTEYIKKNLQGYEIINRDDLVTQIAKESGVGTYDDMYARPPDDLKNQAGPPPEKDVIEAYDKDPDAKEKVDQYIEKIENISLNVPEHPKYGSIKPFDLESLRSVVVKFGVPTKFINPFVWEKVDKANKAVGEKLSDVRNKAVGSKSERRKNMAIDMVNMSINERNAHRRDILKALGEDSGSLENINNHYNQIAVVFAPESGYTPEIIDQIKKVASLRQEEIAAEGGSKTIPPSAYDRMFATYNPPTDQEGFSDVRYVGVPSLDKLKDVESKKAARESSPSSIQESLNPARWQKLAGIIRG